MDFMGIMKKAQEMQAKMAEMQTQLEGIEVSGSAGGDMVSVTLTAKGELRGLKIDPSLMNPDESEILEDLIIAAHRDARGKAEQVMAEKMKDVTGGMPMPPGLNPFG